MKDRNEIFWGLLSLPIYVIAWPYERLRDLVRACRRHYRNWRVNRLRINRGRDDDEFRDGAFAGVEPGAW